ncbi:MAG: hypothetical protein DRQ24_11845 [Candidatus Latescibacterota bacterium]|nr:MAG: hypothetical protein DRQ24_11845 [Candidatus Latescibacterota bacterium]
MKVLEEILAREGYASSEDLLRDVSLFLALSRVEQYKAECELFEKKYGMSLKEFERFVHKEKGEEDFEKEEDLEDWEFSRNALEWWGQKVKELQGVKSS